LEVTNCDLQFASSPAIPSGSQTSPSPPGRGTKGEGETAEEGKERAGAAPSPGKMSKGKLAIGLTHQITCQITRRSDK